MAPETTNPVFGPTETGADERLVSWKEIATYVKCAVRTAKRWEKQEDLPVHRHLHDKRGTVYAYKSELDAWWNNRRLYLDQQEQGIVTTRRRRLAWLVAAPLALTLAALLLAASRYVLSGRDQAIDSIAVLPFVNASADPDMEYLSDGISESVINDLSPLPKLRVVPRSTVFRYKGQEVDPQAVGKELNVRAVLTGRVLQRGDTLVVKAELVDVVNESQLWGEQYNRKLADIFAVQEEITKEISAKLQLKLTGEEKERLDKRYTKSLEAYQAYLKGRYFWNKRTEEGLRKGIEYFEQAIEKDQNYALAYAGLADSYNILGDYTILPPKEVFPRARAAAIKALEFDDTLAEAHTSLAYARLVYDWDWPDAEKEFKRAIELNPAYPTAHQWYSEYLAAMGRFDEAIAEAKRAQELDPLSLIINATVGLRFYVARQYDQAIEECRKTLELDPNFAVAHSNLGFSYLEKAMYEEAIAEYQEAIRLFGNSTEYVAALGYAYAVAGKRRQALKILYELTERSKERYVSPVKMALLYLGLGQRDQALEWLEKAYEERCGDLIYINAGPRYDRLRSEPRFQQLRHRMGFPE